MRPEVLIIQRRLPHYRVALFEELRGSLDRCGINLRLAYGRPNPEEVAKYDSGRLEWAEEVRNSYVRVGGKYLCWQAVPKARSRPDLVITTQENSFLRNYPLLFLPRDSKLAFWGHGSNLQSKAPNGLREKFKRWASRRVDWWFAYTALSADIVSRSGFDRARITVLNNTIDTSALRGHMLSIDSACRASIRESLGFKFGPVGVFVGSLYSDKRLDFLFESVQAIRNIVTDFNFVIMGDGPDRGKVEAWCAPRPWARWVGMQVGEMKARYLSIGDVFLNPGLVGLGILDSFVAELPIITTDGSFHSPEIAYLKNGVNGLISPNSVAAYVDACVTVLRDSSLADVLRVGCAMSANEHSVSEMAERFTSGIVNCVRSS